jgi:hypothetical protein
MSVICPKYCNSRDLRIQCVYAVDLEAATEYSDDDDSGVNDQLLVNYTSSSLPPLSDDADSWQRAKGLELP